MLLSLLLTIYNFCTNLKVHQLEYAIARDGYTAKLLQLWNIYVYYNKLYHNCSTSWVSYDSKKYPDTYMFLHIVNRMCPHSDTYTTVCIIHVSTYMYRNCYHFCIRCGNTIHGMCTERVRARDTFCERWRLVSICVCARS